MVIQSILLWLAASLILDVDDWRNLSSAGCDALGPSEVTCNFARLGRHLLASVWRV